MTFDSKVLARVADVVLAYRPGQKPRTSKRTLSALELCAGGGGAALGLEQAGFSHVALVDNDPHACATLRGNRPYWNVIQADIARFDSSYWRGVDLLSGGLPCPPFSIAGKQLGADDDRNMFPYMLEMVKEMRPRAVMIENVRGIITSRFAPFREKIDKELDSLGFDTYWAAFNAADFGVPQNRYRAFLVWPTAEKAKGATVGAAIGDMMGARGWRGAAAWAKGASDIAPTIVGGSHKHGGPDLGPTRARREWAALGVDGLGLADEAPAPTFTGMPRLTVPMVARIQDFPFDWKFAGPKTHAYRQVGNALPVGLAYKVAKAVRECLS